MVEMEWLENMIIETQLEFEVLGALHALGFDDNNRPKSGVIYGGSIYDYFKKLRKIELINGAIESLERKGVIQIGDLTPNEKNLALKYKLIFPTAEGMKIVLAVVEPYWVYVQNWETKYSGIREKIVPTLNESEDWDIFKTLYEHTSWRKDYKLDDDVARSMIDAGKEIAFYGKFKDKARRSNSLMHSEQRQVPDGKYINVIKLYGRFKPLAVGDFSCLTTAQKYYKTLFKLYSENQGNYSHVRPFLKKFKKITGELPNDLDSFFDHLASLDLLHLTGWQPQSNKGYSIQLSINYLVDKDSWEEWELNYITSNFNPQSTLLYRLQSGDTIEFNSTTLDFEINEVERQNNYDLSTLVSGEEELFESRTKQHKEKVSPIKSELTGNNNVFVVYGRNENIKNSMFAFLEAIGLKPLLWHEIIEASENPLPYVGEVLDKAFKMAQAVVVLLTPDDEARLKLEFQLKYDMPYEKQLTSQARPNVLFEAGMALGHLPKRTIMVEFGSLRPFSDLGGRHVIRMDNTPQRREELAKRLKIAGCPINLNGTEWLSVGDFFIEFALPYASEMSIESESKTRLMHFEEFLETKVCQGKLLLKEKLIQNRKAREWYLEIINGFETAVKDNDETMRLFKMSPAISGANLEVLQVYPDSYESETHLYNHKFIEKSSDFLMRSKAKMNPKILKDEFDPKDLGKWVGEPCPPEDETNG